MLNPPGYEPEELSKGLIRECLRQSGIEEAYWLGFEHGLMSQGDEWCPYWFFPVRASYELGHTAGRTALYHLLMPLTEDGLCL